MSCGVAHCACCRESYWYGFDHGLGLGATVLAFTLVIMLVAT